MNIKPGCLALVKNDAYYPQNRGALVEVVSLYQKGEILPGHTRHFALQPPQWAIRGIGRLLFSGIDGWQEMSVARESVLKPFGDTPGNEQFVVEARKSLPRRAAAKGDTIDARGEVHS